jgi:hypothetical protein
MTPEIAQLPFDQLRSLHREIGALLAQKRMEALEELKGQMDLLGFSAEDFAPQRKRRGRKPKEPDDFGQAETA